MKRTPQRILGIAMADHALLLAQVHLGGAQPRVIRQSCFDLAAPHALDDVQACGLALAAHLKEHGYTAREAVVGLPARHVMTRHRSVPAAADADALGNMLRLGIERDFPGRSREWTFDYHLGTAHDGVSDCLLVATRAALLEKLSQVLTAARVRLRAATPTALVAAAGIAPDRPCLFVSHAGAELLLAARGGWTTLMRLPVDDSVLESREQQAVLTGSVMRALASQDAEMDATIDRDAGVTLLADRSVGDAYRLAVRRALEPTLKVHDGGTIDCATALARGGLPVDLVSSKLAAPSRAGLSQRVRIAGYVAAVVVLLLLLVGWRWWSASAELHRLRSAYDTIAARADTLDDVRRTISDADPWYRHRPGYLDCLAAISHAFPVEQRIWVTSLRIGDDLRGSVKCRAANKDTMLACLKAMQASPALTDVQLRDWSEADRAAGIVGFEITFTCTGVSPEQSG